MTKQHENKEIFKLHSRGDSHGAFTLIVKNYGPLLHAQIFRLVKSNDQTNDVLQNVFIKVFQNLNDFRKESNLYTWLYRIARNESLNYLAKEKVRFTESLEQPLLDIVPGNSNLDSKSPEEIEQLLLNAVESLPEKQAVIFEMKYFQELKYSEMAEILQTSEGALKAGYHHARQKIEKFLINALNL